MINELINKYLSRKLFVFVISTVLLFLGKISELAWLTVASVYMATNLAEKYLAIKNGNGGKAE